MKAIIYIALALIFNTIFWEEELAINWFLFVLLVLGVNFKRVLPLLRTPSGVAFVSAVLVSAFMLVWQHTVLSAFASLVALICCVGVLQYPEIRTVYSAGFSAAINFFKLPDLNWNWGRTGVHNKRIMRFIRLGVLPFLILFVFFLLFRGANVVFREATDHVFGQIARFFDYLFMGLEPARIFFFLFALAVAGWIWFEGKYPLVKNAELPLRDNLQRVRRNLPRNPLGIRSGEKVIYQTVPTIGLKNENRSAVWMVAAVCILLAVINVLDVVYVWFGVGYSSAVDYSAKVHEGVYFLIASILLSIAIVLYVFRRNQNFYTRNRRLIQWTTAWIALNALLVVSVFIRNFYYISHQGLTYKRIGVIVFLIVVALGLYSLLRKVRQRKSFFFMSKFNSWTLFALLICSSVINWDVHICRYNVRNVSPEEFDVTYLMDLSDEALLELALQDVKKLEHYNHPRDWNLSYDQLLRQRVCAIREKYSKTEWSFWSWNFRDERILNKLRQLKSEHYFRPVKSVQQFKNTSVTLVDLDKLN